MREVFLPAPRAAPPARRPERELHDIGLSEFTSDQVYPFDTVGR
jgi:hypothetical protein